MSKVLAAVVSGGLLIGQGIMMAQGQSAPPREIWYGRGQTIAEQLRPGDDVVTVERVREGMSQ